MTFDELEVGKEYVDQFRRNVRLIGKATFYVAIEMLGDEFQPFRFMQHDCDFRDWRPYVPPPAPVVRYVYACQYSSHVGAQFQDAREYAAADPKRVGPVVRVELPVDPDLLARVRDGAK